MAKTRTISFEYNELESVSELSEHKRSLIEKAQEDCNLAYAPYSQFRVGAAILLENGSVVVGSNKENASFPAGTCAERNTIGTASDLHPGETITSMAIASSSDILLTDEILAPCGICRQVMCESENNQRTPIELLVLMPSGKVLQLDSVSQILPFHFNPSNLKK